MLYSRRKVDTEPLVVALVLKAVQLLSASALSVDHLTSIDIDNIIHAPKGEVFRVDDTVAADVQSVSASSNKEQKQFVCAKVLLDEVKMKPEK